MLRHNSETQFFQPILTPSFPHFLPQNMIKMAKQSDDDKTKTM